MHFLIIIADHSCSCLLFPPKTLYLKDKRDPLPLHLGNEAEARWTCEANDSRGDSSRFQIDRSDETCNTGVARASV